MGHGQTTVGAAVAVWVAVLMAGSGVQAQERLTLQRLSARDLTPLAQRATLDMLRPDFLDRGKREDIETGWGFQLALAGVQEGDSDQTTLEPQAGVEASGRPFDSLVFEGAVRLASPESADPSRDGGRFVRGRESFGALWRLGGMSGVDIRAIYDAAHGDDPARTAHDLSVGPGAFFDHGVRTMIRPRISFAKDHTYGLQFEYNAREVVYNPATAPLRGFRSEEIAGGLTMCFEELGPAFCIPILRYTYAQTRFEPTPKTLAQETRRALTAPRDPGGPMPALKRYSSASAQVGLLEAPLLDNIGLMAWFQPTLLWDDVACRMDGDVVCEGKAHFNRRGGFLFGGGVGYHHAIDDWAWGVAYEHAPGHSPDGTLLGSTHRVEVGAGYEDPGGEGFGGRFEAAVEHFEEIFCAACLEEDEEPIVEPGEIEDNSLTRLNMGVSLHRDLGRGFRLGASLDGVWGTALDGRTWAIDESRGAWRHEASVWFAVRE